MRGTITQWYIGGGLGSHGPPALLLPNTAGGDIGGRYIGSGGGGGGGSGGGGGGIGCGGGSGGGGGGAPTFIRPFK